MMAWVRSSSVQTGDKIACWEDEDLLLVLRGVNVQVWDWSLHSVQGPQSSGFREQRVRRSRHSLQLTYFLGAGFCFLVEIVWWAIAVRVWV